MVAGRPPDGSWVAEPVEPPLRDTVSPVAALAAAVMLLCSLALTQADTRQRQIDMAERFVADYELLEVPPAATLSYLPAAQRRLTPVAGM